MPSGAVVEESWVKVSPDGSVTPVTLPPELFHAATSTTSRLPAVTGLEGWIETLLTEEPWAPACWTKTGGAVELGVTALDGADAAADPAGLEAVTVNV